jgi:diguanylate cyclase (GGDEF)-like protein
VRILVVDDDRFFRELLVTVLERYGHQATAEADPQLALQRFEPGRQDLILADLLMPGLDGLQLMDAIHKIAPQQEIILLTGKEDANTAVQAMRSGASDFLLKPLDEASLLLAMERAQQRVRLQLERMRLLDENLEFIKHQALYRRCLDMLSTLDLERLQEGVLSDLCAVCDAQSGALWVVDEKGDLTLRAYRGLVNRARLSPRVEVKRGPLAEGLQGRSAFRLDPNGKEFFLPLWAGSDLVAMAMLGDKLTGAFNREDEAIARAVGDFASTALRNARRFVAMERLGLRDRDTGAYNLAYFVDYAGKEAYKARRYGRSFSLLTLAIDNLDALRGHLTGDELRAALRGVVTSMSRICRDADVIAKSAEAELYVLLPETDLFGAMMFARRAQAAIREDKAVMDAETRAPMSLSFGVATFPKDGEDFDELVHCCRERMEEGRLSLYRRLMLDSLDFWAMVDLLLGTARSPRLPLDDRGGSSRRGVMPEGLFERLQGEAVRELARDASARGLLYVGVPEVRQDLPLLDAVDSLAESSGRVYLMGRRAGLNTHPHATLVYLEGDERIQSHEFLIMHSEHASYALLKRRGPGPSLYFHSSDTLLVDGLVYKLQQAYDLQPF